MVSSMSDPVTNVEIEDVLSSIRRLVSTGERSQDAAAEDVDKGTDKLVLTPALRVPESETKPAAEPALEQASEEHAAEEHAAEEHTGEYASDNADTSDPAHVEEHTGEAPHEEGAVEATAEPDDGSPEQDAWSADDEGEDTSGHAEPDHEPASDPAPEDAAEPAGEAPSQDHSASDDPFEDQEEPPVSDEPAAQDSELIARVAEFEDAVAARDDNWEPDVDDREDDNAAQPMEALTWEDADTGPEEVRDVSPTEGLDPFELEDDSADLSAPAADLPPDPAPEVNAFTSDGDPLGDEAAILDEEALRDLVTEIVRQELQGSLGERITRNVRKLVRREIHRALATKELE